MDMGPTRFGITGFVSMGFIKGLTQGFWNYDWPFLDEVCMDVCYIY